MKPPANPVTPEDAEKFAIYIAKWQRELNLHDWRVIPGTKRPKGVMAEVSITYPAWIPCWSVWVNDDVVIKHRLNGGIHATHNNTIKAGRTIVTGHLHSLKVTPFDDYNGTRWGVDTGTLADPHGPQFEDYLETSPTNWRSGFVVMTWKGGRLMWPEIVRVWDNDNIEFRGEVINVRD